MKKRLIIIWIITLLAGLGGGYVAGKKSSSLFGNLEQEWAISIYTGESPFDLQPAGGIEHPVLSKSFVTDVNARFVADPFMVRHDNVWYMFFEILNNESKKGDIGLATSEDALQWRYGGIVLDEPFHLSYPQIILHDGEYYMVPESYQAYGVRLYKADRFPDTWVFVKELVEGKFVDATLIQHDGSWWMFAANERGNDSLYLFFADSLTGPWTAHPQSPVVRGNANIARPGGRIILYESKLYRFGQDDIPEYGNQLWAFEIAKLTRTEYAERPLRETPVLTASGRGWNSGGMHHLDAHQMPDGTWIGCVDGFATRRVFAPFFSNPQH